MRREISIVLAGVVLAVTAYFAFLAVVFGFGLQCDESCGSDRGWQGDPDAWQWQLIGWSGVLALGAAIVLLLAAWARIRGLASAALVVWTSIVVGSLFLDIHWYAEHHRWLVGLTLVSSAAILAVLLIPEPRARTPGANGAIPTG